MKLAICTYDSIADVSGVNSWVRRLLPVLAAKGHEVSVLLTLHGDTGPTLGFLRRQGFDVRVVQAGTDFEERIRWTAEQVEQLAPDVFVPNFIVSALFAARCVKQANIPTVAVLHSDDPYYHAIGRQFVDKDRFAVSALVPVSTYLEDSLSEQIRGRIRVQRIPYGIVGSRSFAKEASDVFRVTYFGRLSEWQKRIGDVTRALCRIAKEIPGTEAHIFGEGSDAGLVDSLITASTSDRVARKGRIEPDDVYAVLPEYHAMVLLSDFEGLPVSAGGHVLRIGSHCQRDAQRNLGFDSRRREWVYREGSR